jgi:hypothetical protein
MSTPQEEEDAKVKLNSTNIADLIWILDRAIFFFESQGETTWARRAERYKEIFLQAGRR